MALGLMVVDDKGYAQGGSALKTSIENMKKKYGISKKELVRDYLRVGKEEMHNGVRQ